MSFSRRISLFLIGLFFGTVLVYYTLGDNERLRFNWLPNSRVVNRIADKLDTANQKNACFAQCLNLSFEDLKAQIIEAEVIFDSSKAQKSPPEYFLMLQDEATSLRVQLRDKASVIQEVKTKSACNCTD